MRHRLNAFLTLWIVVTIVACAPAETPQPTTTGGEDDRPYLLERVDDAAVVQLYADGFEALPLQEKTLIYHLYEAALAGRDIFIDQRYAHSLEMRDVIEEIGLDPISWTPYDVHGRCSGCQGQEGRTRRSFGGGS